MSTNITAMPYGHLVVVGEWRFSFVKKEKRDAFELGQYAGPISTEHDRLWSMKEARRIMLRAGHRLVVQ